MFVTLRRTDVRTPTPEGGHPVAAPSIVSIDLQCVMFFKLGVLCAADCGVCVPQIMEY